MSRLGSRWARSLQARGQGWSIGRQVFVLYAVVLALVVGAGVLLAVSAADRLVREGAEERVLAVAKTVASMPATADGLVSDDPAAVLQPIAERVREQADVSFVVVMSPDGVRYTHPNPERIGGPFVGTIEPAQRGENVVETFEGTLGQSVRAVVPVREGGDGRIVGLVSVGVSTDRVTRDVTEILTKAALAGLVLLVLAGVGLWYIAKRLARLTFGMRPVDVVGMYAHHEAVLHAVREGLVVVDRHRRVALVNDAARDLLGLDPDVDVIGRPVDELPVAGDLARLLASGDTVEDEVHLAGERLVVVSQVPVGGRGDLGTVLTLRDRTQVMALADELSSTRSLAEALRAQVHESANRLHTVVMLAELGDVDAAVNLATGEVRATRKLTNQLVGQFEEQSLVALLLGKVAQASQRSVELVVTPQSRLTSEFSEPVDLVTIVGNLVDNAVDATLERDPPRRVELTIEEDWSAGELVIRVADSGPGFTPEGLERAFEPGWSTKPAGERRFGRGIGLALVQQVVHRRGGRITIANSADAPGAGAPTAADADGNGAEAPEPTAGATATGATATEASTADGTPDAAVAVAAGGLGGAVVEVRVPLEEVRAAVSPAAESEPAERSS
ncbi:MAG TPA: sensor histidine kinase [Acidimicrobiales bacterium]